MQQAVTNQTKIQDIRRRMLTGAISYEQAKAEAQPIIDAINAKAVEVAKRHNVKPGKLNFAAVMR